MEKESRKEGAHSLCKELGRLLGASLVDDPAAIHEDDVGEELEDVRRRLMDGADGRLLVGAVGAVAKDSQGWELRIVCSRLSWDSATTSISMDLLPLPLALLSPLGVSNESSP